ncbi:MAG: hypothetical protein AAB551_04010 [Patescibacteria group bacterium]
MDQNLLIIIGVFVAVIVLLGVCFFFFRKKVRFSEKDIGFFRDRFVRLEAIVHQDPRFVVMEADKLFDRILGMSGYEGSLAEKMRRAEKNFHDVQGMWRAHKLRNFIAHEVDASISVVDARNALRAFKRAFRDLGIPL